MATREEVINNLRACEKGNCNECTYSQCKMCEAQNSSKGCYDKLMLDAASLLQCDEVNDICGASEKKITPEAPDETTCEERRICKQDGHLYAEIIPLADRIDYISSFIREQMKYKKSVRLSLVDELYELVKYYDRFAVSEEDNRDWGSF